MRIPNDMALRGWFITRQGERGCLGRLELPRSLIGALAGSVLLWGIPESPRASGTEVVFTRKPVESSPAVPTRSALYLRDRDGTVEELTADFDDAREACIAFDAKKMVFAGRLNRGDPCAIWEMNLADRSFERVIAMEEGDCSEPIYLAHAGVNPPLFDAKVPWIAFVHTAPAGGSALYVHSLEEVPGRGRVLWRTTFGPDPVRSPCILSDGRLVFSSIQQQDVPLMFVTWAGDNLNLFYRALGESVMRLDASALPGRRLAFVECGLDEPAEWGGALCTVRLQRPLHALQRYGAEMEGRFRTPLGLSDGRMLVAYARKDADFGIYWFDQAGDRLGPVFQDELGVHELDPQPVLPTSPPMARIPMVEFASVLDIPGFSNAGQLHCMNVYDSTLPEVKRLPLGTVRWARFITVLPESPPEAFPPMVSAADPGGWPPAQHAYRILGEVPVEPDGSFFVNLSGNRAFAIQLLDADRLAVATMRAWAWVRSKGQRGCIGCHEDKELSPQNRATDALLKKAPTYLTDPESSWGAVGFHRDIAPVLAARCAGCHQGKPTHAGLDFTDSVRGYLGLVSGVDGAPPMAIANDARASRLVRAILRERLSADESGSPVAPMPPDRELSGEEQALIATWVDLGCRWSAGVERGAVDNGEQSVGAQESGNDTD